MLSCFLTSAIGYWRAPIAMRTRNTPALLILGCAMVHGSASCKKHGDRDNVHVVPREPNAKADSLGTGDVRVFNADSSVELELLGSWISAGLSQKTLDCVRRETDTAGSRDGGLGGAIASIVKTTVAKTIGRRIQYPVADVKDVKYENGTLVFEWKNGHKHDFFEHSKVNGRKTDQSFTPEEAQKFIAAVKDRMAERAQPMER